MIMRLISFAVVSCVLMSRVALASDCDGTAKVWLASEQRPLPENISGFEAVPSVYKRSVFRMLSPEVKSHMWRQYLSRYLIGRPGLSKEQAEVLREAIAMATPELFRSGVDSVERSNSVMHTRLQDLSKRFVGHFGEDEARRLLGQLGEVATSDEGGELLKYYPTGYSCTCSNSSDWCSSGYYCGAGADNCQVSDSGCGTFWTYSCVGHCFPGVL
ncbi:bacteriocin fulvocin C-related protein [Archangium sp. Cb G35]|uniref:bacteriocin fulvocin C-related protein n=1 Tax=Archangium sp. Cb G35 TaxID=1920190 RepID=UPI0013016517|nr:bacteriocin fulvocin C-related protein [Archangium sp. Cb G35]